MPPQEAALISHGTSIEGIIEQGDLFRLAPGEPRKKKADSRRQDLKEFILDTFQQVRLHRLESIATRADWVEFEKLLTRTKSDPFFTLSRLKDAWLLFLGTQEPFVLKQGKPLAYFCNNVSRFLGQTDARWQDVGLHKPSQVDKVDESAECEAIYILENREWIEKEFPGKITAFEETHPGLLERMARSYPGKE